MRPHRPAKPGQIQVQNASNKSHGGGGGGLGAAIAGYPDVNNGDIQTSDTEGSNSGSGEGTSAPTSPVVAKPNFLQTWLNPALGQGYANFLYNINPSNQAALQRTQVEGKNRLDVTKESGNQARITGSAATDNAIREATATHTLAMADKYGISPDKLQDYQNDQYNFIKQTAMSNAKTGANLAANQADISGGQDIKNSQRVGMNAEQQQPFFKNLALGGRMEAGPGQRVAGFGDIYNAPLSLNGATNTSNINSVTTKGPASAQFPGGIPMGGSTTMTGQSFDGGSMSQPQVPSVDSDTSFAAYKAATSSAAPDDYDKAEAAQPTVPEQGQSTPISTKPPVSVIPGGGSMLDYFRRMLQGSNTGQYNPPSGTGY